jgi:hypothetical protein
LARRTRGANWPTMPAASMAVATRMKNEVSRASRRFTFLNSS